MRKLLFIVLLPLLAAGPVIAADGIITLQSAYDVQETVSRLEGILGTKGMTIFNRIKHSQAAAKAGVELRETELVIFGNPKVGSPMMQCQQSVAIDLPQKALIWQDEEKKVWISYNDPKYLQKRHDLQGCEEVFAKVEKALAAITKAAASKE